VDVVHLHEFRTVENLLVVPHVVRRNLPLVLSPHGTLTYATGRGGLKAYWDRWLSPRVMPHVRAIVGLTDDETNEARALWASSGLSPRTETIPNGIDSRTFSQLGGGAEFRTRWGLGDAVVCLFLGRLHARKGIDVLVRAFVQAAIPDSRLVVAGPDDGMLATLRALAGADPRIVYTGFLDTDARLAALAAADVFALPAMGEGLSMAMLEALAAGVPLLLSPDCHLPEAEREGAALIVPPEVGPLRDSLRQLMTDAPKRAAMAAAGRQLAAQRFDWEGVAAHWQHVYTSLKSG
jgi:glycosyltransferase involved in cell wall biosynthesis